MRLFLFVLTALIRGSDVDSSMDVAIKIIRRWKRPFASEARGSVPFFLLPLHSSSVGLGGQVQPWNILSIDGKNDITTTLHYLLAYIALFLLFYGPICTASPSLHLHPILLQMSLTGFKCFSGLRDGEKAVPGDVRDV